MQILTIETASLGDRSYVVHDGTTAAVIDPQRDIDRVLDLLAAHELELAAVFETHVHNDYVTGGFELARTTGAAYHLNGDEQLSFDFSPIRDGDEVRVGALRIRALHTPGHTPTHLSYVVGQAGRDVAVFTGGSLLYGSVGRTDLIAPDRTEELSRLQHRSAHRLAAALDGHVEVRPTHGFGSFCSSGSTTGRDTSTVADELRSNDALTTADEQRFVQQLMAGLDAYPAYYAHMGPLNRRGPAAVDLSPVAAVEPDELHRRIGDGEWVVDLRPRTSFAEGHVAGTINVELADAASTYLGWLIPWGTPVTLLADHPGAVAQMQRQLVRIGIDRPAGQVPDVDHLIRSRSRRSYRVADFADLRAALDDGRDLVVVDARRRLEWEDGHLPGALHIPLHELEQRLDEIPDDREVWVHCESGYRASIAASLLARAGWDVVLVDDQFTASAPRHVEVVALRA